MMFLYIWCFWSIELQHYKHRRIHELGGKESRRSNGVCHSRLNVAIFVVALMLLLKGFIFVITAVTDVCAVYFKYRRLVVVAGRKVIFAVPQRPN